ncbi:MAG: NYN domain-containing protein [Sedimentisphaerales bacterium]|nr:NYN domain-containing protein [Sedimentisphaerales bacterium]
MSYIFDGYNLYHAACKALEQWSAVTVTTLFEFVAGDLSYIKQPGKVIFDGFCPRGREYLDRLGPLHFYYSGNYGLDADSLIEDMILEDTAPKKLTIVSSDRRIRSAARSRKAVSLSSNDYLFEMMRRYDRPGPAPREPKQKQSGLTPAETNYWLKIFGVKDEDK